MRSLSEEALALAGSVPDLGSLFASAVILDLSEMDVDQTRRWGCLAMMDDRVPLRLMGQGRAVLDPETGRQNFLWGLPGATASLQPRKVLTFQEGGAWIGLSWAHIKHATFDGRRQIRTKQIGDFAPIGAIISHRAPPLALALRVLEWISSPSYS
jgi:hypothetical protein